MFGTVADPPPGEPGRLPGLPADSLTPQDRKLLLVFAAAPFRGLPFQYTAVCHDQACKRGRAKQLQGRLGRLQDSNAVLTHINEYSEQCFAEVSSDFASKTRLLKSMKADLEHIFTKLRGMKGRLASTYPDAFPDVAMSKTMDQRPDLESPLD